MGGDDEIQNTGTSASQQPLLTAGLSMPKALILEGNLAANWKKCKRTWDNYAVVARLTASKTNSKLPPSFFCIGKDASEIFKGLDFPSEEDRKKLEVAIMKFQGLGPKRVDPKWQYFMYVKQSWLTQITILHVSRTKQIDPKSNTSCKPNERVDPNCKLQYFM